MGNLKIMKPVPAITIFLAGLLLFQGIEKAAGQSGAFSWEAGISRTIITPDTSMWMAGYGHRDHPAEGKYDDLWAKALVLQDQQGDQVVLITSDLLGFPKKMSDRIRDSLNEKHGFTKAQVILNSTHTHSGPVLEEALYDIYPLDEEQLQLVKSYSSKLEKIIVNLVEEALANKVPARLFAANGTARFQVNRRNNSEKDLFTLTELKGPNDHAVPVIKVEDEKGDLLAITFGYACHPTVLDGYYWSGDYPGFAQVELEKNYPGVTALFFQGASGDQNPLPRRSLPLARQYGKTLASAVERVLEEEMKPLSSTIKADYQEINLSLAPPPSEDDLTQMVNKEAGYMQRWASRILAEIKAGKPIIKEYPFPLQIWQLGEQPIFNMGGEVVVAYSNELKKIFGPEIFVMAYSNDVMGYIPSEIILEEGGYEGYSSQMVYGLPNIWNSGLQEQILQKFTEMGRKIAVPIPLTEQSK